MPIPILSITCATGHSRRHLLRLLILNLLRQIKESIIDIHARLRTRLEKAHVVLLCELLALLCANHFNIFQVSLISDEDFFDITVRVLLDLFYPFADVFEGFFVRAVVGEDDAHGAFVVGLGDGAEAFLACCVPDL